MRKGKKRPLDRLVALVARLRSPRGCPWDRKQTHLSLIPYLQEEARELAQALRRGDPADIEDELGDVLLQILLHSELARERGQFDIQDVAQAQYLKLRRRHPHVFGDRKFKTAEDVLANWGEIKAAERRLRARDLAKRSRGAAAALALVFLLGGRGIAEEPGPRLAPHLARLRPDGTFLDPLPGTGSGFDGDVNILLPQPDRKVVALGDFGAYAGRGSLYGLARLGEDGSLDVQFAKRASKPLSENGRYDCAAFLSGWRLALGGFFTSYGGHAANGLLRLSPEGGMDKPFLDKAMDLREISAEGAGLRVRSVAPARGGRLLIAGDFDHRPAVLMLEPDGTNQRHFQAPPDSTYFESVENRGSILTATLPDGSILLAGSYRQKEGGVVGRVVRLLPGGTRDRRFSAPDFVGGDRSFQAMVVQRDGSVVLGGSFSQVDDFAAPNLARLGPDGTPDRAFARKLGDGFGRDAARRVRALLLLKDGSILAAGAFGVGRLLPDGRVDAAFAENQAFGFDGPVQALALGADGAVWVGGAFTGLVDPKSPVIPWNRCAAASDCRAVRRPCGDWDAVNRLYAADVAAYNEKRRGSENCVYIEYPRGILACERKACVLNPAP